MTTARRQRPRFSREKTGTVLGVALVLTLTTAGCSSADDDQAESANSKSSTTAAASPSQPPQSPDGSDGFRIPEALAEELAADGRRFEAFTYPEQPDGVEWPILDWPTGPVPDGVDANAVDGIVDRAFGELSDEEGTIDAILVVQGGRLVVERYNDWDPEATHNSWSMAKSILSAMIGILVGQGRIDIAAPFPAPEWQSEGDPRAEITWDHLLRMSSGLQWDEDYGAAGGDVLATLGPDNDRGAYVAAKPLSAEPGSTFYYSTGTSNLLARGVADVVGRGDEFTDWADLELFGKLGITMVTHSVDRTGVISGGSFMDLRPRDFARFGLLYVRGGVWEGEQLLPKGWVDYSRTPTPSDPMGSYGAHWWLMPERPGVFYASGFNGQTISVVPERDLVVVVLSNAGDNRDEQVRLALLDAFGA